MIPPKVSVVIPCYKVELYLDRCVESVVRQTLEDLEIILVDDGSPDRVPEMCDNWALKDNRIKVIHKKNAGLGMACNSGIEVATGKYIAFLDSDDWVDTDMYQTMYDAAEKYQAQMVFTGLKIVDVNGNEIGVLPHKQTLMVCSTRYEIENLAHDMIASEVSVFQERTLQMSAKVVLYNQSIITNNRIRFVSEREVMSEDLHFNLAFLCKSTCVCVLPQSFYNYRTTCNSLTRQVNLELFEKIKDLYQYTKKECDNLGLGGDINLRIMRMFIGYSRDYMRNIFRSNISLCKQKKAIKEILNDPIWKPIWEDYPINKLPFMYQMYIWLMRRNSIMLLSIILKFR